MAKQLMAEQSRVALLLAAVRRRQRQAVESRVADLRLSSQKFWLLEALEQQDGCTLAQLLGSLAMDQPTASRVLAELRSRGLVHVAMDSRDRRRRQLKLTAEGARVARRCSAVAQRVRKASIANFSEKELANLAERLEQMLHNLDALDASEPARPISRTVELAPLRLRNHATEATTGGVFTRTTYWRSLRNF